MSEQAATRNPMRRVISVRDFRLLLAGATTSLLGDQFALIATPWLVLKLTGDPLTLGIVLALEGIPRAVFMLIGGVITDRLAPRLIMLIADIVRLVLTALMALAVLTGIVQVWMLYVFGLGFGLVAGFAIPAENSIVPMLVSEADLQAGNSLMMGSAQLIGFVGPTVAGLLIGGYSQSVMGIGLAFVLDTLSFAASAACLWAIRGARRTSTPEASQAHEGMWASIWSALKFIWNDETLRLILLILLVVNFLWFGPMMVGIPVLADKRLPEGAVAFGLLMSADAGGNLAGTLLSGALRRPSWRVIRFIVVVVMFAFGFGLAALGYIPYTWMDFGLLFLLGLGNGYCVINLFTWMQIRTPKEKLGTVMSIFMLMAVGLAPVASAVAGAVSKWNLELLFVGAGAPIVVFTVWMVFQPSLRMLCEGLAAQPAEAGASLAARS